MRILHTIPGRNWGGLEQRTLEQVRWLVGHGHDAWLATPPDGETYRAATHEGLPAVPMAFDPPWRPATLLTLRRFVRDHGVEVIDAHGTRDAKAVMACLPFCAVVRSRHVNQPLRTSLPRRMQWRLGADHIITVAETSRRHLLEIGLADPSRSTSIGGWADERFFGLADAEVTRRALRAELGLAVDATVVLCVGMLRPDKGQQHLMRAVSLLRQRGLLPTILLAGAETAETGAFRRELAAMAGELAIAERVRFLGYRADVPQLMQAADLVVIPSLTEAQPRVAVQSFATGRPVIATDVGGVAEIVEDGVTGWLVPPEDPERLAEAMAWVIANPDRTAAVADTARRLAETTMRIDQRMEQTLATYRTAVRHAHARPFPRFRGAGRGPRRQAVDGDLPGITDAW